MGVLQGLTESLPAVGPVAAIFLGSFSSIVLYWLGTAIYNIWFHPLRNIPGPISWSATSIPFAWSHLMGTFAFDLLDLHNKYGEVVRMGPNQVGFINGDAWKDVYGYVNNKPHFTKDKTNYFTPLNGVESIHSARDDAVHSRHRRLLAHAFSEKALREQEGLLKVYVDLLISQLKKQKGKIDMVRWLNYTTFDLIGDLTFGEPFGCLRDSEYHPWVAIIFQSMRASTVVVAGRQFPALANLAGKLMPKSISAKIQEHWDLSVNRMNRRLETKTDRPDFVTYMQKQVGEKGLSLEEFHSNAPVLMIGGSETTGTALSACLYFLMTNPRVYQKLRAEFDSVIKTEEDITLQTTFGLTYMTWVLNETMRIYNPVPGDLPRVAPKEGAMVAGYWLPPHTRTSMSIYAATHSEKNFREPFSFIPERWDETNELYASENKSAFQPFSTGPRNCIGKNLAWAEMRLILSKLLINFDFELCPESQGWQKQKEYVLWEKPPLMLNLKPRY